MNGRPSRRLLIFAEAAAPASHRVALGTLYRRTSAGRKKTGRQGYAMVMVLLFIALVLSFFSLSYRHLSTALRVETARTLIKQRDEGSVHALAAGLTLLETGLPPTAPNAYVCATTIETSQGEYSYTVTFSPVDGEPLRWTVTATPTDPLNVPDNVMPTTFAPPEEPPEEPPVGPPPPPSPF